MKVLKAEGRAKTVLDALNMEESIEIPNPLDISVFESQIITCLAEMSEIALAQGQNLPESVSVGVINTKKLNAHIIPIEGESKSRYLLAFNNHLYSMVVLFSRMLACILDGIQTLELRYPTEYENMKLHEIVTI